MFNWLKNKLNNLVPNDINDGLMTSNFCTIKIGSKIKIPDNVVGFVYFKDKMYLEMNSGEHILNEESLINLYKKQLGKKKSIKKLNLDLFFVNLSRFEHNLNYKDKIPVNHKTTKLTFDVKITSNVTDAKSFLDTILITTANVNSRIADEIYLSYIEEFLRNYFLKVELDDFALPEEMKSNIFNKLSKFLNKMGVSLHKLEINLSENTKLDKNSSNKSSFFDFYREVKPKNEEKQENTVDQKEKLNYTLNSRETQSAINEEKPEEKADKKESVAYCPRCQNKLIQGSKFCHRCGYQIK